MSGFLSKITAVLLLNILVVQGKTYQKDEYLLDENHVERSHHFYSDIRSDYGGDAEGVDGDAPKRGNDFGRLNFESNVPEWLRLALEDNKPGSGRYLDDHPLRKFPGLGNRGEQCQNIQGLPRPESGCCGVQLTRFPMRRRSGQPSRHTASRYRRSPDFSPNKMIRGGKATDLHQLPWMARLSINPVNPDFGTPKTCGGTIISSRYVLTAAHCVHKTYKNITQLEVFLAEYDTSEYPQDCVGKKCIDNVVKNVDHVIVHPKYNDTYLNNDVALIRLSSEIPYTDFIRPICLPTADIVELSEEIDSLIIAGWGLDGRIESNLKQAATINYVSNEECKSQYSYKDDGMFCSIGGHGEDICHGDSGGPLMVYYMDKYFLSGVVNGKRKDQECGSSVPSLFNNVFYHLDWIKTNVQYPNENVTHFSALS